MIQDILTGLAVLVSFFMGGEPQQPQAFGAFGDPFLSIQEGTLPANGDVLQTDGTNSTWVATSTLGLGGSSGTGSNWQFSGTSAITPTTTVGVLISASSTIGNGTAGGGLTISGTGTSTDFRVADGGTLVVGHSAPVTLGLLHPFQVLGTGTADAVGVFGRFSNGSGAPRIEFLKSRATTIGGLGIVQNNDILSEIRYHVDDGTDYATEAAVFQVEVDDGSPAANDVGAAFVWESLPGGGDTTLNEVMRIGADGLLTFGNATSTALSTAYASSTIWRGGGLISDCDTAATSKLLWDVTSGQFSCGTDANTGLTAYDVWTHTSVFGQTTSATSTLIKLTGSPVSLAASSTAWFDQINVGSTTLGAMSTSTFYGNVEIVGNLRDDSISSALLFGDGIGDVVEYTGTSCTNQFVRSLDAAGQATCASVVLSADVTGDLPFSNIAQLSANSVWANSTGATADGASVSTTTLFGTIGASSTVLVSNGTRAFWQDIASFIRSTIAVASLVLTGNWDFGGATGLEIPNGTAPTIDTTGDIGLDTTSEQIQFFGTSAKKVLGNGNFYKSFSYPGGTATSTWTGTTTIPLGPAYIGETWNGVQCFTDVGTLNVSFYDGTNRMNLFNASTTVGTVTLSTSNTFTAGEKRYVDIGTPATSPTKISCTASISYTAD